MKLLTTTAAINKELNRLLRECLKCQIAVAWASVGFKAFDLLKRHSEKIERMVVGTHLNGTDPSFIKEFLINPRVRFMRKTNELFHPKVYFFEKTPGTWECIVGSPNFTRGGFGTNHEMAVLVSSEDQGANDALKEFKTSLDAYWQKASSFNSEEYEAYKKDFERNKNENADDNGKSPSDVPILHMTWADYFDEVKVTQYGHSMDERLKVIRGVKQLFAEYPHFNEIGPAGRRQIAGLPGTLDKVDYGLFGSMRGAGRFWSAINNNDENLSLALDLIPLAGSITREIYLQYIERYRLAFSKGRDGVPTATRLLAMKRPDTFVCLDSKNKTPRFRHDFEISQTVGYEKYWDSIIAKIMESAWWRSPSPSSAVEREVWEARAAFLDSVYYEENG